MENVSTFKEMKINIWYIGYQLQCQEKILISLTGDRHTYLKRTLQYRDH